MIRRALQDITNVKNKNIKVTITKEEDAAGGKKRARKEYAVRREIPAGFLEYKGDFWAHSDTPISRCPVTQAVHRGVGCAKCDTDNPVRKGVLLEGVSADMRRTLVEWLFDVKMDFGLQSSTYQLAVRYVDRFVLGGAGGAAEASKTKVTKKNFQLLGCAALFVASKINEPRKRRIGEFIEICDNTYTQQEFLEMERLMLAVLGFDLHPILPSQIIIKDYRSTGNALRTLISELVLLDIRYAYVAPSHLAALIESSVLACIEGPASTAAPEIAGIIDRGSSIFASQPKKLQDVLSGLLS